MMVRTSLFMPKATLDVLDSLAELGVFASRSEAIRALVADGLQNLKEYIQPHHLNTGEP